MHPIQARPLPVRIGTPEQFESIRSGLQSLPYDEAAICARTGVKTIFSFQTKLEGRKTGTDLADALDALIHLLIDGETMPETGVRSLVPASILQPLLDLGVLAAVPGKPDQLYGTVALYPVEGVYVISDRTVLIEGGDGALLPDSVFAAISVNTQRFLSVLPSSPCESLLDLCAGTGVAALSAASRGARHAWSCDLVPRSVAFSEFNRQLNGLRNVTCLQGDLYQPVAGLTFDRIVAHPPYVPADEQRVLFRDGGPDGEQILRGVIEGLPRHLSPGGRCYIVSVASDRDGETVEQRIRRWLGPHQHEFDVMLVAISVHRSRQAEGRNDLLEKLNAKAIFFGVIVLERQTTSRPPVTARTRKSDDAASPVVEWYAGWHTSAAAPGFDDFLADARPHPAAHFHLHVMHAPVDGKLTPVRFELVSEFPFMVQAECPNWLAVVVGACDGHKTARQIFDEMKGQQVIHPETPLPQFLCDLRQLIAYGLLELDEFPLPAK